MLLATTRLLAILISIPLLAIDAYDACAALNCTRGTTCAQVLADDDYRTCKRSPCQRSTKCIPNSYLCQKNSCKKGETCYLMRKEGGGHLKLCKKHPQCPPNEEYNECNRLDSFEPTCTDKTPICLNSACGNGGCECAFPYRRHNGKCIDQDECPDPTCQGKNEVWSKCVRYCTHSCRSLRGLEIREQCTPDCYSGCDCAPGYVRDDDRKCVKESDCPTEFKCAHGMEWKECSSLCIPTCDDRELKCEPKCGVPKCQCKKGYFPSGDRCRIECPLN